jgi:hypothetical protein
MAKQGWHKEPARHSLAARGVSTRATRKSAKTLSGFSFEDILEMTEDDEETGSKCIEGGRIEGCNHSQNDARVKTYYRVEWKNGVTDVQIRKMKRGGYKVIEHCNEHLTPDGTGISTNVSTYLHAIRLAKMYADTLGDR